MKKRFGDTKTHLTLTSKAREAYDNYSPLSIWERETEDDEYLYDITGCLEAADLTETEVNEMLESLLAGRFRVKNEYRDLWSNDPNWDGIVTEDEIERLAREWGKSVYDLMTQVEEV